MTCPICSHEMRGVVTIDPVDGKESTRLECEGPLKHIRPFTVDLAEVMSFRARVWRMMEVS